MEQRLYGATQVRELDRRAIDEHGIDGYILMQRAAQAGWRAARERWPQAMSMVIVCGSGNNGGDGYELARLARAAGYAVTVLAVDGLPKQGAAAHAVAAWQNDGGTIAPSADVLPAADVVVDAILGTGLSRAPDGRAAAAIAAINAARAAGAGVLALDLPSGLDATTGAAFSPAVTADVTVSFIGNKLGLYTGEGPALAGHRRFDTLQVPAAIYDALSPLAVLQHQSELVEAFPPRRRSAHKGDHGHVLIVGGNHGTMGAALLAGRAALRCGAGLVSVATRPSHAPALTAAQPELMCRGSDDPASLRGLLARADVVAIGPGLGTDAWAQAWWSLALESGKPLLVDADALNLLAAEPQPLPGAVLTPHPGEAARLLGCRAADIQADRLAALAALQERYRAAIVLKGAGSLVSGVPPALCPYGNPGLAVGGTGDVLSGVIAALRGQGLGAERAARLGVLVHALAADTAALDGERGLLPSDLLGPLRHWLNPSRP